MMQKHTSTADIALAAVSTMLAAPALSASPARDAEQRPNIILVMTDQQTEEAMSCAGNPWVKTPAMDQLAADGIRFTRAYSPYPVSGPCRASIITGQVPFIVKVRENADVPDARAMEYGLGHRMSEAGYDCLYAGKWHVPEVNLPEEGTGFRKLSNMNDPSLGKAIAKGLASRDRSKPLFLVASYLDPHEICEVGRWESLPYGPVAEADPAVYPSLPANHRLDGTEAEALALEKRFSPRTHDTYTYSDDDWRHYLYCYYRLVERVDSHLAELIQILKRQNLYDNSIIFFCSDHGDGVASHEWNQKWALYEESINVPFIVKPCAGSGQSGKVNEKSLINIGLDLYSTFCDYAGIRLDPKVYKGSSLRPVIEGRKDKVGGNVYVETRFEGVQLQGWSIVSDRYKYVLYQWGRNREALYDLQADPGEMHNLIGAPEVQTELKKLRKELLDWAYFVKNPLLTRNIERLVQYQ